MRSSGLLTISRKRGRRTFLTGSQITFKYIWPWAGLVVWSWEWNSVAQIQWGCAFAATEIGRGLLACVKLALLQHLLDGPLIFLPTAFKGGFLAPIVDTWRYEEARRGGLARHNPNALYGRFS